MYNDDINNMIVYQGARYQYYYSIIFFFMFRLRTMMCLRFTTVDYAYTLFNKNNIA